MIGSKMMTQEQVNEFQAKLMRAERSPNKRELKIKECLNKLEEKLNLIGVTAVEDLLQFSVRSCIEHIREARIKGMFWVF